MDSDERNVSMKLECQQAAVAIGVMTPSFGAAVTSMASGSLHLRLSRRSSRPQPGWVWLPPLLPAKGEVSRVRPLYLSVGKDLAPGPTFAANARVPFLKPHVNGHSAALATRV